jgi:hypothetical protein
MKNLALIIVILLVSGFSYGQSLRKGNVLGFHELKLVLDPDVTLNQWLKASEEYVEAWEKAFPGVKTYQLKGLRGENENGIAFLIIMESDEVRNKYWVEDGSFSELGRSLLEKNVAPVGEKLNKLGTTSSTYTDWEVQ